MEVTSGDRGRTYSKIYDSANPKITGPGAASMKYDVLTALLVTATTDSGVNGRLALRLSLVITSRFNWRSGVFNVGLRELARMWGVTERTAKREMAQMRALRWISVEKPAARGRVAQHRIEFAQILRSTAPHWDAVGPDFAARMTGSPEPDMATNIVPLRQETVSIPAQDGTSWPEVAQVLKDQDSGLYVSWFANLTLIDTKDGCWSFIAPTPFSAHYIDTHLRSRLLVAISMVDRSVKSLDIQTAGT